MTSLGDKSLLRTVGEGSAVIGVSNVILKLLSISSTFLILRELSLYDYGIWRLLLGALSIAAILTLPAIEKLIVADVVRETGEGKRALADTMVLKSISLFIILGLASGAGLFLAAPLITSVTGIDLTLFLRILSVAFLFSPLKRSYTLVFHIKAQFVHMQGVQLTSSISYFILLLVFFFNFEIGILAVVLAYLGSAILPVIFYLPVFIRNLPLSSGEEKYFIKNTLAGHGKWVLAGNYFDNAIEAVRPWLIGYVLGIEALAVISVAITFVNEIANLLPLQQALSPILPRHVGDKDTFVKLFAKSTKYSFWFYLISGVASLIFAPIIIPALFPQYASSVPLFMVALAALLSAPFGVLSVQAYYALKEQKSLFFATAVPKGFSTLILLPALMIFIGVWGAAIQYVIAGILLSYSRMATLYRKMPELKIPVKELLSFDEEDKLLLRRIIGGISRKLSTKI